MQKAHIMVGGDVHGVGFRYFVKQAAERFDIKGYVKNIPGGMEIIAEGTNLEKFIAFIKSGPSMAKVENFVVDEEKPTFSFNKFEIR
jgi:acylphosphatase